MKRFAPYALLALLPRAAFAGGVLNILLAGAVAALLASASPSSITYNHPGATFTSGSSATCAGHGGFPPYTYGWSWASGGASISIDSASSAATTFTVTGAALNTTYSGVAQCRATDSRPLPSLYSGGVSISLTRIPLLPPAVGVATLVGAGSGSYFGYSNTASYGFFGSLSPSTDYSGYAVNALFCAGTANLLLQIQQPSSNSSYITDLSVNGTLFPTSGAAYGYTSPNGTWSWPTGSCSLTAGSNSVYYY